jgi:hypothetical protein
MPSKAESKRSDAANLTGALHSEWVHDIVARPGSQMEPRPMHRQLKAVINLVRGVTMFSFLKRFLRRVRDFLAEPALEAIRNTPPGPDAATQILLTPPGPDAATQILLMLTFRRLVEENRPLPRLNEVGFKCYSQTDEDGILLFLFSVIGVTKKLCVEVCAGDGIECNTANLILNHGWHALLVDGDKAGVERGIRFFAQSKDTYVYPPRFVCSWVTRGSVNELLSANGFQGEIDLLSLDLDGMDYWIWESIERVSPRVVVIEYQDILGPERSWTVPYADDFSSRNYPMTDGMPNFAGASLSAFVKLGRRKGYRLVGVNRYGYNAFFVRNGLGGDHLPEIEVGNCFSHSKVIWGMRERFATIKDFPWVEV